MDEKNRYAEMTYIELMRESDKVKSGKDARLIHRELMKFGDGLPFWNRYPFLVHVGIVLLDVVFSAGAVLFALRLVRVN